MEFIKTYQRLSVDELRQQVIGLLQQAYADGRIGVDSLERRLKDATGATDKETLLLLVADIPPAKGEESDPSGRQESERTWLENDRVPRENQTFFAILGASNRTGRWQPARQISCLSLMGGVKLDFREAEFPRGGVKVNAGCVMGGLEIIVPPGVNAEISGIPLLGGMENRAGAGEDGAPTLSVRGIAIMGGMEIKRKETKKPGKGYRKDRAARRRSRG